MSNDKVIERRKKLAEQQKRIRERRKNNNQKKVDVVKEAAKIVEEDVVENPFEDTEENAEDDEDFVDVKSKEDLKKELKEVYDENLKLLEESKDEKLFDLRSAYVTDSTDIKEEAKYSDDEELSEYDKRNAEIDKSFEVDQESIQEDYEGSKVRLKESLDNDLKAVDNDEYEEETEDEEHEEVSSYRRSRRRSPISSIGSLALGLLVLMIILPVIFVVGDQFKMTVCEEIDMGEYVDGVCSIESENYIAVEAVLHMITIVISVITLGLLIGIMSSLIRMATRI